MALVSPLGLVPFLEHFCEWIRPGGCLSLRSCWFSGLNFICWDGPNHSENPTKNLLPMVPASDFLSSVWLLSPGNSTAVKVSESIGHSSGRRCWWPKRAVLRAHLRDRQVWRWEVHQGLHVWQNERTWNPKLGPCIVATWQVSSWQGWVSLLYPTSFFCSFVGWGNSSQFLRLARVLFIGGALIYKNGYKKKT